MANTHVVVLLAVGLSVLLEELSGDLLLADEALEARLVVHLAEGRAVEGGLGLVGRGWREGAVLAIEVDLYGEY